MAPLTALVVVAPLFLSILLSSADASALPEIPSSAFEAGAGDCGCHDDLVRTWELSMHAQALSDPIYRHELELANEATDGALQPFCDSCHTPIAVMAGELGPGVPYEQASPVAQEGVTCDFCHQVTGRLGDRTGNASYALDQPDGTKRAQYDDSKSPSHETAYSPYHETAEFCGTCHDVYHPTNGLPLEMTYTEWKEGPYAAEGITCQDCHMTPGPGVTKPFPGKAASFGVDRDHVYLMTFAGGNVGLGDSELAEERLKAAAEVRLAMAEEYVPAGGETDVTVTVENVGAGHYLPTGLVEFRRMWLEFVVTDEAGAEVARERHDYRFELADATGAHPVPLWEATSIAIDERIPPKETDEVGFSFTMPGSGRAHVTATLYYRSVSEEVAEAAGVEIPTTLMTEASQAVYASAEERRQARRELLEAQDDGGIDRRLFVAVPVAVIAVPLLAWGVVTLYRRSRRRRAETAGS